ncbi:MAG: hypothetical protein WAW11_04175 [Patescibacteria group bacterium]
MKKIIAKLKNKKILIIIICTIILLIVGWLKIINLDIKIPSLYISSESSKTIQAVQGGYSWSNWHESVIADSIHPTEFTYTTSNILSIKKNSQIILSNKKNKIDRQYPFELISLECFDANKTIIKNYTVVPTYINGDLYINTPAINDIYICSAILKYKNGTAGYGYKLIITD